MAKHWSKVLSIGFPTLYALLEPVFGCISRTPQFSSLASAFVIRVHASLCFKVVESLKQLWEGVPLPGGQLLQGIVTQLRADWKWHVESWPLLGI